jgi:hypothetical protein
MTPKSQTPQETEAGAPEDSIEVTPAMIEAGYQVLAASGLADDLLEADKLTVVEIYLAMQRLALRPAVDSLRLETLRPTARTSHTLSEIR